MTETMDQQVEETVRETENLFAASSAAPIVHEVDTVAIPQRMLRDELPFQDVTAQLATPQRIYKSFKDAGVIAVGVDPVNLPIDPLREWLNTTRVSRALAPYEWFRGTLRLRILFRVSATVYGSAYAWWWYGPECKPTINGVPKHKYSIVTSSHCDVIDLAEHEELIWDIPYRYPTNFFEKTTITDYITVGFETLHLDSLEAGAPKRVDFEVWASLHDAEVSGYIDAQAMPLVPHREYMAMPGVRPLGTLATVSAATAVGSAMYHTGTVVAGSAYGELKRKLFGTTVKQATEAYKAFTKSGTKSAEAQQTPVIQQPYGNTTCVGPANELQTLSEMSLAKLPPGFGGDEEYHSLSDIVQIAGLYEQADFQGVGGSLVIPMQPSQWTNYMAEFSSYFRFYRGRYRVVLHFFTSPLLAARFTVQYTPVIGASLGQTDAGHFFETFEVKGSCTRIVEIPWVSLSPVRSREDNAGEVRLTCVDAAQPLTSGGPAKIFVLAHVAMAPGTQFFSLKRPALGNPPEPAPPLAEKETESAPMVKKPGGWTIMGHSSLREVARNNPDILFAPGVITPIDYMDEVVTVEEIMGRWCSRKYTAAHTAYPFTNSLNPSDLGPTTPGFVFEQSVYGDNVDSIVPMFTLWRGSRDFRSSPLTPNTSPLGGNSQPIVMTTDFVSQLNAMDIGNGGSLQETSVPIQLRIPYLSRYPALLACDQSYSELTTPYYTNHQLTVTIWNAWSYLSRAGPDFQVFHLNRLYTSSAAVVSPV